MANGIGVSGLVVAKSLANHSRMSNGFSPLLAKLDDADPKRSLDGDSDEDPENGPEVPDWPSNCMRSTG